MSSENRNLEFLAAVASAVFEEILLNLDRASIFSLMATSRILRRSTLSTIKRKKVLPYNETTVELKNKTWKLGFNTFNFYGFVEKAPRKMKGIVQFKKPFGKDGSMEMYMGDLAKIIKGFAPKKYIFDFRYDPVMLRKNLNFMRRVKIEPGTETEIVKAVGDDVVSICATTKPKKLILHNFYTRDPELFTNETFQCVWHLSIRGVQSFRTINLEPISGNLVSFDFSGDAGEYPGKQINILLKKWWNGKSPLREVKVVIPLKEADTILDDVLEGIQNTAVEGINQLPLFMQTEIAKDLVGLDWKAADIAYRILLCNSKRQMGCFYFSKAIEPSSMNAPGHNVSSYLGFHVFDYPKTK